MACPVGYLALLFGFLINNGPRTIWWVGRAVAEWSAPVQDLPVTHALSTFIATLPSPLVMSKAR